MASSLIIFVLSLSFHQCWTVMAHLLCLDWMDPLPLAHFPLIYRRHSTWTHGKDILASKGKIWHLYLTMFFKWAIYNSTEIINNHSFCHSQIKCLFCKIPFFEDLGWECIYANALIGAEAPVSSLPSLVWKTSLWLKGVLVGVAVTESALIAVNSIREVFSLWLLEKPSVLLLPVLGKKKSNHDRSWHSRKCLGKECVHSALPWGLITSAATKQPASFLL